MRQITSREAGLITGALGEHVRFAGMAGLDLVLTGVLTGMLIGVYFHDTAEALLVCGNGADGITPEAAARDLVRQIGRQLPPDVQIVFAELLGQSVVQPAFHNACRENE